jgi:putative heme iron utilization protein
MDLVSGDNVCRVLFPQPLAAARQLRAVLVDMVKASRAAAPGARLNRTGSESNA